MIYCDSFETSIQLTKFCNNNKLTKKEIISIIFKPDCTYSYVIFYEK